VVVRVRHFLLGLLMCAASLAVDAAEIGASERLFQRNCAGCHMQLMFTFGPPLSRGFVNGREDWVRKVINEGGIRMPGFRYILAAKDIDDIMKYLSQLEVAPTTLASDRVEP
jgi:mono/diheme cytochrome c family protein